MNFAVGIRPLNQSELNLVDPRIKKFIDGWTATEKYDGNLVVIPHIYPVNYFEATIKPGQPISEAEKQLVLWCGWRGQSGYTLTNETYDGEVIITLSVDGQDAIGTNTNASIHCELSKSGGAPMKVFYKGKLVTDFMDRFLWFKVPNGYQTVYDMNSYV